MIELSMPTAASMEQLALFEARVRLEQLGNLIHPHELAAGHRRCRSCSR